MFLLLSLLVLSTDVLGYHLADLTLPSNPHNELEITYEKCLSMRKILYEDQCWDLLSKGPCNEGQWLVLDWDDDEDEQQHEQPLTAKCTRRRCSESDLYWPWDGFCYSSEAALRRRLCPRPDTEVATDEFGDGYCECRTGGNVPYVRLAWAADDDDDDDDEDSRPCYPVYSKGPCPRGRVLTPFGWGYGNCTADQCAEQQRAADNDDEDDNGGDDPSSSSRRRSYVRRRQQQRQPQPTAMAPWSDGRCYRLGTAGPCAGTEQFAVIRDVMRPGCVNTAAVLDLFSNKKSTAAAEITVQPTTEPPPRCKTDHRGACVDGVDVATDDPSYGFKTQLLASAKRHSKRNRRKKKRTP